MCICLNFGTFRTLQFLVMSMILQKEKLQLPLFPSEITQLTDTKRLNPLWESNAEMRNLHLQSSRPCSCCPRRLGSKASPKGVASFFVANGLFVILIKRDPHRYCWVLHIWLDDPFNLSWTIMGGIKIVSLKLKALAWNPYWEEDSCQAWNELWHWQDSIIITSEVYVFLSHFITFITSRPWLCFIDATLKHFCPTEVYGGRRPWAYQAAERPGEFVALLWTYRGAVF